LISGTVWCAKGVQC